MSNKMWREDSAKLWPKCFCSDSPEENIWNKIEKFSKIGRDYETLISNFGVFFDYKILISGRDLVLGYNSTNLRYLCFLIS